MKGKDVTVGTVYEAKVSGRLARVKVTAKLERYVFCRGGGVRPSVGYRAVNLDTNRLLVLKSSQRLRRVAPAQEES
jgi:hypothetical protein